MASIVGGLVFTDSTGGAAHVGFSTNGVLNSNGGTVAGALNVEIFTTDSIGSSEPPRDAGYDVSVVAPGASLTKDGFVDPQFVQLYAGDYQVFDEASGGSPQMVIIAGSGNQTLVGSGGDTLIGGTGNQLLNGLAVDSIRGSENIVGGTGLYTVYGGVGDTIIGSTSATSVTSSQIVAGFKDVITLQTAATVTVSGGTSTISAGVGDTITSPNGRTDVQIGLSGNDFVNLTGNIGKEVFLGGADSITGSDTIGGDTVTAGNGPSTIYGASGDSLVGGGAGASTYIDAAGGSVNVVIGNGGSDTIVGSFKDTISGGAAAAVIQFLGAGELVNLTAQTGDVQVDGNDPGSVNDLILLGASNASVFGGTGDTINMGSVAQYVDGRVGGMTIAIGNSTTTGVDTIFGSTVAGSLDTITGGSAAALIQIIPGTGTGDLINLTGSKGIVTVEASPNDAILLGGGAATVFGATGDTVAMGSVGQYVDGTAGGMTIADGSAGTDSVIGSSVAGSGDVILGGKGSLDYNAFAGGDTINLGGSGGTATINAFISPTHIAAVNDSIIGSLGADSVWGGKGDTIGLADVSTTVAGGNRHLWGHTGATTGSVQFGTFNTDTTGGSNARVTIGGPSTSGIGDFVAGVDRLFYPGDNPTSDALITATKVTGGAQIVLPDGSTLTLIGQSATVLNGLNGVGKLFTN